MIFEIIGMFTAAMVPAAGVSAIASAATGAVNQLDRMVEEFYPEELFDETNYYIQHLRFQPADAQLLGLHKTSFSLSWSEQELGSYALHEGWILKNTNNTPQTRAELRRLLRVGEERFVAMAQYSE